MAATAEEQVLTMITNLENNSGVKLTDWLDRARGAGSTKHGEIVKHLKTEYGIGHGYANLVAHKLKEHATGGTTSAPDLVTAQYAGRKANLKPLYDQLADAVGGFGDDVELAPKKSYVSLRRKKQFGLIQPSTATRMDVGLNLKGVAARGRLEASGSFNAMVTHRVRVTEAAEIDDELVGWLREAYAAAG